MAEASSALIMVLAGILGIFGMFVIGPILLVVALVGFANKKSWAKKVLVSAVLVIVVPLGISFATLIGRSLIFNDRTTVNLSPSTKQTEQQASALEGLGRPPDGKSFDELEMMIDALPRKKE